MLLADLRDQHVNNVYLYIGDAVRWDSVPDKLLNAGLAVKSIASGIHSPTSIASIVSGTYLPQHRVEDFDDRISEEVVNLLHMDDVETRFLNTINDVRFDSGDSKSPIVDTLDTTLSGPEALGQVDQPFFILERGPGGHAPYIRDLTAKEYFESRGKDDRSRFRCEYDEAVAEDIDWFFTRIELLRERGLLGDTLVIYVSDHGELLGEKGMLAHSLPIHPKHVYVPTVFIHPKISTEVVRERVVRHVDLAPAILNLLESDPESAIPVAGRDLIQHPPAEHGVTFHRSSKKLPSTTARFGAVGAWDANGGYVFCESGNTKQLLLATKRLLRLPWRQYARRNLFRYLSAYLAHDQVYGTPSFDKETAVGYVEEIEESPTPANENESITVPEDRLIELGYLE